MFSKPIVDILFVIIMSMDLAEMLDLSKSLQTFLWKANIQLNWVFFI